MAFSRTLDVNDLARLRELALSLPEDWTRDRKARELAPKWEMSESAMTNWLALALFGLDLADKTKWSHELNEKMFRYFREGKFGKEKLCEIAMGQPRRPGQRGVYMNPSYRESFLDRAVENGYTMTQIVKVKELLKRGKPLLVACEIVEGSQSESSTVKEDDLEYRTWIIRMERYGIDYRKACEALRMLPKIHVIPDTKFLAPVFDDLLKMKVALEDMTRFVDKLFEEAPKEIREKILMEYRKEPTPVREGDPMAESDVIDVQFKIGDGVSGCSGDEDEPE